MAQNSHPRTAFSDYRAEALYEYAMDIAYSELEQVQRHMKEHPADYPDYIEGRARLVTVEEKVIRAKDGFILTEKIMDEIMDAHSEESVALAIEMYLRGILAGGRIQHAFTTQELPQQK